MSATRSGFMLLMLVVFSSIILGLSVTFYRYCQRGLEDSAFTVKVANQRLALLAAINYVSAQTLGDSSTPRKFKRENADATLYTSGPDNWIFDLNGPSGRTKNAGWYRLRTYSSSQQRLTVMAGVGPSNGIQNPTMTNAQWSNEYRKCYVFEMNTKAVTTSFTDLTVPSDANVAIKTFNAVLIPTVSTRY